MNKKLCYSLNGIKSRIEKKSHDSNFKNQDMFYNSTCNLELGFWSLELGFLEFKTL